MGAVAGFEELDHTADWALRVWAPDRECLFAQAAAGMMALMGVRTGEPLPAAREITAAGPDDESRLVGFLTEILLVLEAERIALAPVSIEFQQGAVTAMCMAAPVVGQEKEIKAVTYHHLAIREREGALETVIVFDV